MLFTVNLFSFAGQAATDSHLTRVSSVSIPLSAYMAIDPGSVVKPDN